MLRKSVLTIYYLFAACYSNATAINLLDAVKSKKIELTATGNGNNPQGGSHTGKCLQLKIKNNTAAKIEVKIESAYQFENQRKSAQDLMVTENMIVSVPMNETKTVNVNALCTEKNNGSPSEKDTFILIKRNDSKFTNLTAIFEKHKSYFNTAQQAVWCFTDNNAIDNIYDTDKDTVLENTLVAYVSNVKGVPVPERHRYVSTPSTPAPPRILRYPLEVDSSFSVYIDRVTTIGIYVTDTNNHHILAVLFDEETERRTGTAKYSFFYRGQQPKGRYFVEMKKNGEWVKLKEIVLGEN